MELKQRVAKGLVWSAVQRGGTQGISFLVFLTLSRLLGPEDFGLVALAMIFTSFGQIFVDQGFSIAIVQFPEVQREHLDTAFWTAILASTILALSGIAASGLVASFFSEPRLVPIVIWLSLDLILVSLSSTQQALLLRHLDFKGLATRTLLATLVGGGVGIAAALAGWGVYSLVIKTMIIHLFGAIILWKVSDWRPGLRFSVAHFKDLFKFGFNVTANNVLVFLSQRVDNFLIGHYLGVTALGYYSIAYTFIQTLINAFVTTSTSVTLSTFSRLKDNPEQMRSLFYKATRYSSLIAFPAFIGVSILSPSIVVALFGEKWIPSIPVMQLLALMGLIYPIAIFNTQVLVASGKPFWRLMIMLVYTLFDVIGFLIAVRWGIVAVAGALVLRMYLLSPLSYLAVHHLLRFDFRIYVRQFLPSIAGTGVMSVVLLLLLPFLQNIQEPALRLSISVVSGGLAYLLLVQFMAPHISSELLKIFLPSFPWARRS